MRPTRILAALGVMVPLAIGAGLYSRAMRVREGSAVIRQASAASPTACYVATTETKALFCGRTVSSAARLLRCGRGMWRVEYLSAPATGILVGSNGDVQWRLVPGRDVTIISSSPPDDPKRLLENYRARHVGYEKVAGRVAHIVDLSDASGRLARRLFIDRDRLVVLRTQTFDRHGHVVGETTVKQIDFLPDLPSDLFQVPANAWPPVNQIASARECATTLEAAKKSAGFPVRIPSWLPESYRIKSVCVLRGCSECNCRVVHLNYSDGMRSLSVFETGPHHSPSCPFNLRAARSMGAATHPVQYGPGTAFADVQGTPYIIAFGDLPAEQLEKVVRSAR